MKKVVTATLFALGFLCMLLTGALSGLEDVFLDPTRYTAIQDEMDIYDSVGLSREDQTLVNADLAAYLAGETDSLERNVTLLGEKVECAFNERELAHMKDVKTLFSWGLTARRYLGAAAVLLLLVPFFMKQASSRRIRCGALIALAAALVCGGLAAALISTADFSSVFIRFHQLLFNNDLWLLDPATDAMIRMFPEAFFEQMAVQGGVSALLFAIGAFAFTWTIAALASRSMTAFNRRKS